MAAKYESFTIDMAKSAGVDEAQAMVDTLKGAFRDDRKRSEKRGIAAAYALRAALQNGIKQVEVAKAWGDGTTQMPNANMTLWKRCGVVADVLGYLPGSVEWNLLFNKAGANIKPVGQAIDSLEGERKVAGKTIPQSTEEHLRDMLFNVAFTPDHQKRTTSEIDAILAKRLTGDTEEETPESGGGSTGGEGDEPANVPVVGTYEARIDAAFRDLRSVLSQVELGSDVWKKFYTEQAAWVEEFDGVAAKASESAANTRKAKKTA